MHLSSSKMYGFAVALRCGKVVFTQSCNLRFVTAQMYSCSGNKCGIEAYKIEILSHVLQKQVG